MKINLLRPGETFIFKGFEWITLDTDENGNVFAIMTGSTIPNEWTNEGHQFDEDGSNNYAESSLRKKLLERLLPILGEDNLIPHEVDLTADNGDKRYGTVTDKVFILSCDEYRKYRNGVPLLDEWMWTCTPWYITGAGHGSHVRVVSPAGSLDYSYASNTTGVAPACIFSSKNLKLRRQAQMVEA